MADVLSTSIHFLARDELYQTVKPYTMRYTPAAEKNVPRTNIRLEKHDGQLIEDVRGREKDFNFVKDGFEFIDFQPSLAYEDFEDKAKIEGQYRQEAAERIREHLGADLVQVFEHTIRRRHETFPISTGGEYSFDQPAALAHIDTTPPWIRRMVQELNPQPVAEKLLKGRWQSVNLWRPLRGPVRDWPLALCDPKTIGPSDFMHGDLVFPSWIIENCQVHWSARQKWYYLSDQRADEATLFLQSDSNDPLAPGVPHSAFPHPASSPDDLPRESIEIRAIVYYYADGEEP